jgi:hypothetical protein
MTSARDGRVSRREFGFLAAAAAAPAPEAPPFEGPLAFARREAPVRVRPFPMTEVRILGGACKEAAEWNRGYMQRLGADRLVRNFLLNAGLPSPAAPLGGWEQYGPGRQAELRGHFTGHYLSAAALAHASTGDREIKAKAESMVEELAKCQKKLESGYLSAFPTEWFDRLGARKPVWAPFYTYHKILAGMLDMYEHCGSKQALAVAEGMAAWADEWTAAKSEAHMQEILDTEYGGMNEVLYNLAAATGNDRWARAGDRFTKKKFFNPLALRRDELRGLHVNTHIPQVIGAARRYELSGDGRFRDVAEFFWHEVTGARCYVTGGTSNNEGWLVEPRRLAAELKRSVATAECCCAYNMLKLTRRLYSWTADPRYFDYYERTLLNHRLGTIQPRTGYTQYYLSLTPGTWKTFNTEDQSFWCCTGTGVEEYAKLNDSIYWRDDGGVYVNLYLASEANWPEKGFRLRQDTRFPEEAGATLTVRAEKPARLALRLRIPAWAGTGCAVKVNGKAVEASASPGSYLTLARTWKTGDRIRIDFPMRLAAEAMPDDPATQAFLYGPLVLAGDLGAEGLEEKMIVGPHVPPVGRAPRLEIPAFRAAGPEPAAWIQPGGGPLRFRTTGQARDVELAPISSIFNKRYSVYWQVT